LGESARHHNLEAGIILVFSYLGEKDMSVKVFDETRFRRDYRGDTADEVDFRVLFLRIEYVHGFICLFASSVKPIRAPSYAAFFQFR
jgi:hypothetical protein